MTAWEVGGSDEVGEGEPEMEQSREKTSLGRVFGESPEQVLCHDSALALEITLGYIEI